MTIPEDYINENVGVYYCEKRKKIYVGPYYYLTYSGVTNWIMHNSQIDETTFGVVYSGERLQWVNMVYLGEL